MTGNGLPVVLRHGHGDDLVRSTQETGKGSSHLSGFPVEFGIGQGLPSMRNL